MPGACAPNLRDRKSTRLNSSHTEIYTLSLHDALPISFRRTQPFVTVAGVIRRAEVAQVQRHHARRVRAELARSEEHTSELQSHRDLHSFPTRRSSDLLSAHTTICDSCRCNTPRRGRASSAAPCPARARRTC